MIYMLTTPQVVETPTPGGPATRSEKNRKGIVISIAKKRGLLPQTLEELNPLSWQALTTSILY
jgi:hypothetical protein